MQSALSETSELHRDEAELLWTTRRCAVDAHGQYLWSLLRLDDRIDAHLDGVRVAIESGIPLVPSRVEEQHPGRAFVAAFLGTALEDRPLLAALFEVADAIPSVRPAVASALGWSPLRAAQPVLAGLIASCATEARRHLAIAACAAHRVDAGELLVRAFASDRAPLRARALRAAGELGRMDLRAALELHAEDAGDAESRLWALWSLALLGSQPAARRLFSIAGEGGPGAEHAAALAARCLPVDEARSHVRALGAAEHGVRASVVGAAALGDPAVLDDLVQRMVEPRWARLAGWAFSEITGADLSAEGIAGERPAGFTAGPNDDPKDPDVRLDPEAALPFPVAARAAAYVHAHRAELPAGRRFLGGQPASAGAALARLAHGSQPSRRGAALELALQAPAALSSLTGPGAPCRPGLRAPLFPLHAPARRQRRLLERRLEAMGGRLVGAS
ncbi:TIGR02270 family protein [Sorangium sp. So ce542]|uniref:TIGR02270 family protein n=1 Tax=Sorangium sp. So ce542 TaxID=3133316 RepID=UPI003F5DA998